MKEKDALAFYALQHFIVSYNQSYGGELQLVELRQPPEPDALCLLNGEELGVEVTHLYGSDLDARRRLGRLENKSPTGEEELANRLTPLQDRVLDKLNCLLRDKAGKNYNRSPVWLLVRNAFPLWSRQDFEEHMEEILVPENHQFHHIWLLAERDGDLLQLC